MARELYKCAVEEILVAAGYTVRFAGVGRATEYAKELIRSAEFSPCVKEVFSQLGGLHAAHAAPGPWDISTQEFILEFDEEQHFNRYRKLTLDCPLYAQLPRFPMERYRAYSTAFEGKCIGKACGGKYWTSAPSERLFGPSDAPGVFADHGSARWKQRAFYDMIKDFVSLVGAPQVVRIAMWDELDQNGTTVQSALDDLNAERRDQIVNLVQARLY